MVVAGGGLFPTNSVGGGGVSSSVALVLSLEIVTVPATSCIGSLMSKSMLVLSLGIVSIGIAVLASVDKSSLLVGELVAVEVFGGHITSAGG